MRERIITAIIALLLFIPIIWFGSWPLEIVMWLLAIVGLFELHRMKNISFYSYPSIIATIGITFVVLSRRLMDFLPDFFEYHYVVIGIIVLLLIGTVVDDKYDFEGAGVSTLGIFYIGFGFYSFIHVRESEPHLLMLTLLVIWATDIGAYLVGRQIGKRKLAPSLSPNKTIEGAIGGTLVAALVAASYLMFVEFRYSYIMMLVIMIILSVAGQFGDLIESSLKRHFGVKDSGTLLPGHGGILDRFDSMIFVMSIAVLFGLI
jgi:phosphatidate cytidylyltransferase